MSYAETDPCVYKVTVSVMTEGQTATRTLRSAVQLMTVLVTPAGQRPVSMLQLNDPLFSANSVIFSYLVATVP